MQSETEAQNAASREARFQKAARRAEDLLGEALEAALEAIKYAPTSGAAKRAHAAHKSANRARAQISGAADQVLNRAIKELAAAKKRRERAAKPKTWRKHAAAAKPKKGDRLIGPGEFGGTAGHDWEAGTITAVREDGAVEITYEHGYRVDERPERLRPYKSDFDAEVRWIFDTAK